MSGRIFIHIGTHKTGTSAIQDFLLLNRKLLSQKGYLYPQKSRRNYFDSKDGKITISAAKFKNYAKLTHLCQRKNKHVILSSESFSVLREVYPMKTALGNANVTIICYLRRQDSFMQSLYNQAVKSEGCCQGISDWNSPTTLDYYELLNRWAFVFGKENIVVRPYEKQQFKHNDLVADFLDILGIEVTDDFRKINKNANPRLPIEALEYMRLLNIVLQDKRKSRYLKDKIIEYSLDKFQESSSPIFYNHSLLSPDQQRSIIEQYSPSNQLVAQEYLGRENGRLFLEPFSSSNSSALSQDSLPDEIIGDITGMLCKDRKSKKLLLHGFKKNFNSLIPDCEAHAKILKIFEGIC